ELRHPSLELEAALQRPGLLRGPGADLAGLGAAVEIGVGFGVGDALDLALDPHLAPQRLPMEAESRLLLAADLSTLPALILGVEDEALVVMALQQHHADRRHPVGADSRQGHGIGIVGL